jgi:hypothetical protein
VAPEPRALGVLLATGRGSFLGEACAEALLVPYPIESQILPTCFRRKLECDAGLVGFLECHNPARRLEAGVGGMGEYSHQHCTRGQSNPSAT